MPINLTLHFPVNLMRVPPDSRCRPQTSALASEKPNLSWTRRNGAGAHQFHSPNRRISEGTRSARTIVASSSTPTDVLTRRLRDMEEDGIVRRRELGPPASAVVYELTELGRELDGPLLALGRWGMNFFRIEEVSALESSWLPNSLRVILLPPVDAAMTVQLVSEGQPFMLRIADGLVGAERGEAHEPDLTLEGTPRDVLALLVAGDDAVSDVRVEGDREALEALRAMIVLPDGLRDEAMAAATDPAGPTARRA